MKSRTVAFAVASTMPVCSDIAIAAADISGIPEGKCLLGKPLYTKGDNPVNVASDDALKRATAEAKAAYEREPTVDAATWYGRLLAYKGLMRESIAVYTAALRKFPDSGKLLRHRAHRYFNLREFDNSIKDALRATALYQGKPLEREKLGPSYFPSTPDVVQFYFYYHLGQACFAEHQFDKAAKVFGQARQIALGMDDPGSVTAAVYREYLALAHNQRHDDAGQLLDGYHLTLLDLNDNPGSNTYFDGIQLFKDLREPGSFHDNDNKDSGKAFGSADGMSSSTACTLANYYVLLGDARGRRSIWGTPRTWEPGATSQSCSRKRTGRDPIRARRAEPRSLPRAGNAIGHLQAGNSQRTPG